MIVSVNLYSKGYRDAFTVFDSAVGVKVDKS